MACYRPVTAWLPYSGGQVVFRESRDCREIKIACGQCIGCRIARQESWAVRCLMESKCHERNSFVTFTYDEEHVPKDASLNYRDFQLFMKRLRQRMGVPIRFFMCGEYGEQTLRPHFHALLFGVDFDDKRLLNSVHSKDKLYKSALLDAAWGNGFATIGEVNITTARYCAAYCLKKRSADDPIYQRLNYETGEVSWVRPEFCKMSLKPGIGAAWLERYWRDLYMTGNNAVIVDGMRKRIPKYFDKLMDRVGPVSRLLTEDGDDVTVSKLMDDIEYSRYVAAMEHAQDLTPERLAVREEVEIARVNFDKERCHGNAI